MNEKITNVVGKLVSKVTGLQLISVAGV